MCIRVLIFLEGNMVSEKKVLNYFTMGEAVLWAGSVLLIIAAFCIFDRESFLTLAASLVGVTSLIFCAKGNPVGQLLMIVFSLMYGVISYSFAYYGEMVTYLGMTAPMAAFSLVSWLKNPYKGSRSQVKVNSISLCEAGIMLLIASAVTVLFYFILRFFSTANLLLSTFSVTTSFIAVYLTFRRSPYFAAAYAMNDIVLIILWTLAAETDSSYISVIICFAVFLVNDIYGFVSWIKMGKRQRAEG
ncbi:MAG: nicotinamide mononucleotide transporter [Oscillospiraceae bacterium]|nr:nicotinamide mononucleotide transporter [Oscillospiraceae bacterium]